MTSRVVWTWPWLGVHSSGEEWPEIERRLLNEGFTATAFILFRADYSRQYTRTMPSAIDTIMQRTVLCDEWVAKDPKNNNPKRFRPPDFLNYYTPFLQTWRNEGHIHTILIMTTTLHGNEIGLDVQFDQALMRAGASGRERLYFEPYHALPPLTTEQKVAFGLRGSLWGPPEAPEATNLKADGELRGDDDPVFPPSNPPVTAILPYNCDGLFGGIDVTFGFFKDQGIRSQLFQLSGRDPSEYVTRLVNWQGPGSMLPNEDRQAVFSIPTFLDFTNESYYYSMSVTGETKQEYQSKLVTSIGANFSVDGFGGEVNSSFNETDFSETWNKYASVYRYYQVYSLRLLDTDPKKLREYMTDSAVKTLDEGSPDAIVDALGTHFMTSATFGGLRRWSSTVDVRDDKVSTSLGISLGIKVAETAPEGAEDKGKNGKSKDGGAGGGSAPDSGGADISSQSEMTKRLYTSLEITTTDVKGGQALESDDDWKTSLFRNPALVGYQLREISELVLDPARREQVSNVVKKRLKDHSVTIDHKAQIMFQGLDGRNDDRGSGAQLNIANARPKAKDGWYHIGYYAVGPGADAYDWATESCSGLLIRNIPGAQQRLVTGPKGLERRWGMRSPGRYGLFEATPPEGYVALSAAFFRDDGSDLSAFEDQAMVHEQELTVPAAWGPKLWDDSHTGSNDVGAAWAVDTGPLDDARTQIFKKGDTGKQAHLYRGVGGTQDCPTAPPRKLDLSKCKLLTNSYIMA